MALDDLMRKKELVRFFEDNRDEVFQLAVPSAHGLGEKVLGRYVLSGFDRVGRDSHPGVNMTVYFDSLDDPEDDGKVLAVMFDENLRYERNEREVSLYHDRRPVTHPEGRSNPVVIRTV